MINLFYNPGYVKRKKRIFAINLKDSRLLNLIIKLFYFFNFVMPDRYITNGPHKLMNNLIKTFKNDKNFKFNSLVYDNTYIVQFDEFGENVLKQIIESDNSNKKVLIGPLYTLEQLKTLINYHKQYEYIKIAVASKATFDLLINDIDSSLDKTRIVIAPTGVVSLSKLQNTKQKNRNDRCLIYFKNRKDSELDSVKNILKKFDIDFDLFVYKKYKNNRLKQLSKINRFGILLPPRKVKVLLFKKCCLATYLFLYGILNMLIMMMLKFLAPRYLIGMKDVVLRLIIFKSLKKALRILLKT